MSSLLRAEKLTKRFAQVVANDGISLEIWPGEIHCLFGENGAGKSTLSECLYGYYRPDSGTIHVKGKPVRFRSPRDAIRHGIGMVHQHFVLVPPLTVLENIVVGTQPSGILLRVREAEARLRDLCRTYGIELDLHAKVEQLAVGQQQWVEILKALYLGAELLILDEPTAVLTPQESARLFAVIRLMKERGLSIILISHKLNEVMQSDWVSVLRKGKLVATVATAETSPEALTTMMVGREVVLARGARDDVVAGEPVLEIEGLGALSDRGLPALRELSLTVHAHEIVGIAGVAGNGQKELFEVLTGVRPATAGRVRLDGEEVTNSTPREMIRRGVGHIPEDRWHQGLVPEFSIAENLILGHQRQGGYRHGPFFDWPKIDGFARDKIAAFQIDAPSPKMATNKLSGGNAQRVILAREFHQASRLLLANQPTRGLDVGVIEYVYEELLRKRRDGYAILLASEELEDLFNLADRIAVFFKGRIMSVRPPERFSFEEVGLLMAGRHEAAAAGT